MWTRRETMNDHPELTPKADVGLDERWRGAAVVAAIAAVALPLLYIAVEASTDFDYGGGVGSYIDNFDSIPLAATLYLVVGLAAVTAAVSATLRALWVSPVLGTAVLTGACLIALGVIMFTSHVAGHRTLAVLYLLAGANGMGSIITELWPWVLYPPLYLATAVLLLITLRRERRLAAGS
jgi:hypothetical protein